MTEKEESKVPEGRASVEEASTAKASEAAPSFSPATPDDFRLTRLVVMVGGWVLLYLLFNTNNPFSRLITMDAESFLLEAGPLDYLIYLGGHALGLAGAVSLLERGLGRERARELLLARRGKQTVPTLVFVAALVVARLVDGILAYLLPARFLLDLPLVLGDLAFDAWRVALVDAAATLLQTATRQLIVMSLLSLVVARGGFDWAGRWKWLLVVAWLYLIGGLVCASPTEGTLVYSLVSCGFSEVCYGMHFLRCRNLPLTVLAGCATELVLAMVLYAVLV